MDLYEGDLSTLTPVSDLEIFKSIAMQTINIIAYLSSRNCIHRDINPKNFLYKTCPDKYYKCVLADFGLAIGWECTSKNIDYQVYGLEFRAPEILLEIPYTSAADVWALGATLYHLYTGNVLSSSYDEEIIIADMVQRLEQVHPDSILFDKLPMLYRYAKNKKPLVDDPVINDLLLKMLKIDPSTRSTAHHLQHHQLFNDKHDNQCIKACDVPDISCLSRIQLFDRHFDLSVSNISSDSSNIVAGWMLEVKTTFKFNDHVYIFAIEIFYRIQQVYHWNTEEYQLIGIVALYLAKEFKNYTDDDSSTILKRYSKISGGTYTVKTIADTIHKVLKLLNYDLLATTTGDRILSHGNDDRVKLAFNVLYVLAPVKLLFTRSDILDVCFDLAKKMLGISITLSNDMLNDINKQISDYYGKHPDYIAMLPANVRSIVVDGIVV